MLQSNEPKGNDNFLKEFFQKYDALKKSEKWKDIIDLGLKALEDSQITDKNLALIKCRLTSCYYYLGQHKEALEIAKDALGKAIKAENKELQARSLYLISATYRILFLKASEEEQKEQKYKELASDNIEKALKLLPEPDVSNFTKAKVYFNAGALEHDLNSSFGSALKHYSEAKELFKAIGSYDDYDRTAIRYLRAAMEEGKKSLDEIEAEARDLSINKETKTGVQFSLLMSKVFVKYEKYDKALQYADNTLKTAEDKSMQTEIEMLKQIIADIRSKHPTRQEKSEDDTSSYLNKVVISNKSKGQQH